MLIPIVFTCPTVNFLILAAVILVVQITVGDLSFVIDDCCASVSAVLQHAIKGVSLGAVTVGTAAEHGSVPIYLSADLPFPKSRILFFTIKVFSF